MFEHVHKSFWVRQMFSSLSQEHLFGRVRFISTERSVLHMFIFPPPNVNAVLLKSLMCKSFEAKKHFVCTRVIYKACCLFSSPKIKYLHCIFFLSFLILDIVQSWIYGDQSLRVAVINPIN